MNADQGNIQLLEPTFEPWQAPQDDKSIAVLMSGGVDSSVTALLLKRAGWSVLGITMKIPLAQECDHPRPCCGAQAALVCNDMGINHYYLDVEKAFTELIIEPFRQAYRQARTPNPCVDCNSRLKFTLVWDFLERTFGIRRLASGHYARIVEGPHGARLARAKDRTRDQSYFLYGIPPQRLSRLVLPLGRFSKQQVRDLARQHGLSAADTQSSMELCFADGADYRQALGAQVASQPGPILNPTGQVLGQHQGICNYTLGQRRGLGVAASQPLYVISICPQDNRVTLGTWEQAHHCRVSMSEINIFCPEKLQPGQQLFGQIRSGGKASTCTIVETGPQITVHFYQPQFAPCPGQRLVLYDKDQIVVAGGTICPASSLPCQSPGSALTAPAAGDWPFSAPHSP